MYSTHNRTTANAARRQWWEELQLPSETTRLAHVRSGARSEHVHEQEHRAYANHAANNDRVSPPARLDHREQVVDPGHRTCGAQSSKCGRGGAGGAGTTMMRLGGRAGGFTTRMPRGAARRGDCGLRVVDCELEATGMGRRMEGCRRSGCTGRAGKRAVSHYGETSGRR